MNTKPCPRCKGKGQVRATPINARSKGQRGEREVVKILQPTVDKVRSLYGLAPLVIQRNQLQSHLGGEDLAGLDGFAVEVKFCENPQIRQWWNQTIRQAVKKEAVAILFYRATNEDWTVRLRCCINTPFDRDQVEMDVEMTSDEFLVWFECAYDESVKPKTPTASKTVDVRTCTCATEPSRPCPVCHR